MNIEVPEYVVKSLKPPKTKYLKGDLAYIREVRAAYAPYILNADETDYLYKRQVNYHDFIHPRHFDDSGSRRNFRDFKQKYLAYVRHPRPLPHLEEWLRRVRTVDIYELLSPTQVLEVADRKLAVPDLREIKKAKETEHERRETKGTPIWKLDEAVAVLRVREAHLRRVLYPQRGWRSVDELVSIQEMNELILDIKGLRQLVRFLQNQEKADSSSA